MQKKLVMMIVLFFIISSIFVTSDSVSAEIFKPSILEEWSFYSEIDIPIDTGLKESKYQPIDISIFFNNSCWAEDENTHSIRVYYVKDDLYEELECQIYNLNFIDEKTIDSCDLVFLIPEIADGSEKYFVFYDDEPKPNPGYDDKVQIKDSYNYYEPITGQIFESWYYEIRQAEYIIYAITQKGTSLGDPISQQVIKLKQGSKNILPVNGEHVADFNFRYWFLKDEKWQEIYSNEKFVSKKILLDGNLMVKCAIVSESCDGYLRSTVIYKYYYNPLSDKRIYANVKHEIGKYPLPLGKENEAGHIIISCGKTKSNIEDLNSGDIPPYLNVYSDEEEIKTFDIDTNPESTVWKETVKKKEDVDLGSLAWVSADYGRVGNARAIILENNSIIKSGTGLRDGIQVRVFEANTNKIPVDVRYSEVYLMDNTYEPENDLKDGLPQDYLVEFNAEFFSTEKGGYEKVSKEAEIYQSLIDFQPENNEEINESDEDTSIYSLKANILLSPFLRLNYLASKLFLRKPTITAELYDFQENLIGKQQPSRIKFFDNYRVDWKNLSIFNNVVFNYLKPGKYLIKVFLENAFLKENKMFIGYKIIDINEDAKISVLCNPSTYLDVLLVDQNNQGVKNAEASYKENNVYISKSYTDEQGKCQLLIPYRFGGDNNLEVLYQGFKIIDEDIKNDFVNVFIPNKKTIEINLTDFTVDFNIESKEEIDIDFKIRLNSSQMQENVFITPEKISSTTYRFNKLYPALYTLYINYDQYNIKKQIRIPDEKNFTINLHALDVSVKDSINLTPDTSYNIRLESIDLDEKTTIYGIEKGPGNFYFSNIYPGQYILKLCYKSDVFEQQINIPYSEDSKYNFVFPVNYNFTCTVYDSYGHILKNAEVLISRENSTISVFSDSQGQIKKSLPPAEYDLEIIKDGTSIAKRKINLIDNTKLNITTKDDPIYPKIIFILSIIILIITGFLSIKKRQLKNFVKTLIIILLLVSIFTPWWSIQAENQDINTSTNLYINPVKMLTFSSSNNSYAGHIINIDETFESVVKIIPFFVLFAIGLVSLNMVFFKTQKKKTLFLTLVFSSIILIAISSMFYYAMNLYSDILTGSIIGSGETVVSIPGTDTFYTVTSNWGLDLGFYLIFTATIITFLFSIYMLKITFINKKN